MIELIPDGADWRVRVTFATRHVEERFAVYRRACDWGRDRLEELMVTA